MRTALLFGAAAATSIGILTAPAAFAAPSGGQSAALTIAQLEAQGIDVQLNRFGSAPLDQCLVTDIGNVREQTRLVRRGDDLVPVVVRRLVSVTVDCSR